MSLFNYSKKVKIISLVIFCFLLISITTVILFDRSRVKDLELVGQVKIFATGLETYYAKFQAYPVVQEIDLNKVKILTENGLNQTGKIVYYQVNGTFARPVTFLASSNNYTLKFSLQNTWPIWGLESWRGGECRMTNYLQISCL
jgi:hypothetical protein